jgi:hypothetical protein
LHPRHCIGARIFLHEISAPFPRILRDDADAMGKAWLTRSFRGDKFYKQSLGIERLPSSVRLRQRMVGHAGELFDFLGPLIETLLQRPHRYDLGRLRRPVVDRRSVVQ